MSKTKVELINNPMTILPEDARLQITNHLPLKDFSSYLCTSSQNTNAFFTDSILASKVQTCVAEGNVDVLKLLIKKNAELFFEKGLIKAPRGQIYFCSAYQLMIFLCDDDMKDQIMPFISEEFNTIRSKQKAELGCGGADLIKLDRDPQKLVTDQGFKALTEFKTFYYTDYAQNQKQVTLPLLENTDGIFYYQDTVKKEVHFYYANKKTATIQQIKINLTSEEDQLAFEAFKASFIGMVNNSGRRSSDKEHRFIEQLMGYSLVREGISYEHHGILYRDSQTPFNIVDVYRKCKELYNQAQLDLANAYWREAVGMAQGEEIWLLQRFCEKNRRFDPLPETFAGFKRCLAIFNQGTNEFESLFIGGALVSGLGSVFAVCKEIRQDAVSCNARSWLLSTGQKMITCDNVIDMDSDLLAVILHIENAKANIIDLEPEIERGLEVGY